MANTREPKKKNLALHLLSGGVAGFCESIACHPLDTIKVRLQLRGATIRSIPTPGSTKNAPPIKPRSNNFVSVGIQIARKEGLLALYKGLGAVVAGIVPKMAIRFSSFEAYKEMLAGADGRTTSPGIFLAGLGAGATESILVVTPMDVIKIRLQSQRHSMTDPLDVPKYRNAGHAAYVMVKEEGISSLYKGLGLTIIRQGTNQAANFTVYQYLKGQLQKIQPDIGDILPSYQTMIVGFISGACGPLFNAPIDTIKTRIQRTPSTDNGFVRFVNISKSIVANEGLKGFYRGLTPRVLRVAPGQSITFLVYERVYSALNRTFKVDDFTSGLPKESV